MSKLLVVVDYQNDFVTGALGFARATALEDGIVALVEQYLTAGDRVIFTMDTHDDSYLNTREGKKLPVLHCVAGSHGWQLYGKLARYMQDGRVTLLPKAGFGTLGYAGLLTVSPDSITLVGVVTDMCVLSNAVVLQTLYPQAEVIVESRLCSSFDSELHRQALAVMASLQMTVR